MSECVTGYKSLCRKTLRRVCMFKLHNGDFAIRVQRLNPDTLKTNTVMSFWTKESLEQMIALYCTEYSGGTIYI
jgi:hypothetical protein